MKKYTVPIIKSYMLWHAIQVRGFMLHIKYKCKYDVANYCRHQLELKLLVLFGSFSFKDELAVIPLLRMFM
jgi:hypothetical protein